MYIDLPKDYKFTENDIGKVFKIREDAVWSVRGKECIATGLRININMLEVDVLDFPGASEGWVFEVYELQSKTIDTSAPTKEDIIKHLEVL